MFDLGLKDSQWSVPLGSVVPQGRTSPSALQTYRSPVGCSVCRLSLGDSLSLDLIFQVPSYKHPPPPLDHPSPVVAFPCYVLWLHFTAGPHGDGFHFRAEPNSHHRYWNLLPKQRWGWTFVLSWVLLFVTVRVDTCEGDARWHINAVRNREW